MLAGTIGAGRTDRSASPAIWGRMRRRIGVAASAICVVVPAARAFKGARCLTVRKYLTFLSGLCSPAIVARQLRWGRYGG